MTKGNKTIKDLQTTIDGTHVNNLDSHALGGKFAISIADSQKELVPVLQEVLQSDLKDIEVSFKAYERSYDVDKLLVKLPYKLSTGTEMVATVAIMAHVNGFTNRPIKFDLDNFYSNQKRISKATGLIKGIKELLTDEMNKVEYRQVTEPRMKQEREQREELSEQQRDRNKSSITFHCADTNEYLTVSTKDFVNEYFTVSDLTPDNDTFEKLKKKFK